MNNIISIFNQTTQNYYIYSRNDIVKNRKKFLYESNYELDFPFNPSMYEYAKKSTDFYNKIFKYDDVDICILNLLPSTHNFQPIVAIDNKTKLVIAKSNNFINDARTYALVDNKKEDKRSVYHRINYTVDVMLNNQIPTINNESNNQYILFANAFSYANSGHELSIVNYLLNYYYQLTKDSNLMTNDKLLNQNSTFIILFEESKKCPRILEYIELFIPASQFIFIDYDHIYNFKNIHIPYTHHFNINQFPQLFDDAIIKVNQEIIHKQLSSKYIGKNIFLVKTNKNNNISTHNAYICSNVIEFLESAGFIIINPEEMNMIEIISYLSQANKIITSFGNILYTHMNFFNKHAKIIFITALNEIPYENISKQHFNILHLPSTNLDDSMTLFLKFII